MPRPLLLLALLSSVGCIIVREDDPSPIEVDPADPVDPACDVDGDGFASIACGGLDCDDDDPTVYPGAPETFGDEVDRGCDGLAGAAIDVFEAPARTAPLAWRWSTDLRALGGLVILPTGELVAQDLFLGEAFGDPVVLKRRSDYGPALDTRVGVRLDGPVDFVARAGHLEVWTPDQRVGTLQDATAFLDVVALDAAHAPDGTWVVGCDGLRVHALFVDAASLQVTTEHAIARAATTCAVLGPSRDGRPIVVTAGPGMPLERWILDPVEGFTSRLQLVDGDAPDRVRTATNEGWAAMAFRGADSLTVLDRSGYGNKLLPGATELFDLGVAPDGEIVVAWLDQGSTLRIAIGRAGGDVAVREIGEFPAADAITAAISRAEVAVAIQQGEALTMVRALRP